MRTCGECRFAEWHPDPHPETGEFLGNCRPLPHKGPNVARSDSLECWFFKEIEEPEEKRRRNETLRYKV